MSHPANRPGTTWLRWTARVLGTLVAAFWVFMGIGYGMDESEPFTYESAIMTVLITCSAVGIAVAWWREKPGGMIVTAVGIAHALFASIAAGRNKGFAMLISGGPFLLIGILFLATWRRSAMRPPPEDRGPGGEPSAPHSGLAESG